MESKRQSLIKKELKWIKRGAKARTTKQKARLQRFDELINDEPIKNDDKLNISVSSTRLGNKIIEINNISKSFDDKKIIDNFSYVVSKKDRIGIIGKNGMGKSTLIKVLNKDINPDKGNVDIGETVKIGIFSQDDSHMKGDMKAIDYIKEVSDFIETSDKTKISASQMCERFLFNSTLQYTPISKLSGGERRRLHLLRTLMIAPNVLLLDEPTNDLDIETLTILEDYLDDFNGVVITVSHDRYFLDRTCNKIFSYENFGDIKVFTGNYSDYILNKKDEIIEKPKEIIKKEKPKNNKKVKFSYNEQREFDTIDSDIENLEEKIKEIDALCSINSSDFTKLQELLDKKSDLEKELEYKYERWEYLNTLKEEMN